MTAPLFEAIGLNHTFDGIAPTSILRDVSFALYPAEAVAITGVSGSGKSTLLQILGLLARPTSGVLLHRGRQIPLQEGAVWRNREIGFVFQHCHLLEEASALENVLMPAAIARWPDGKSAARQRAEELLCEVGLDQRLHHPCRLLSGGEKQRVAIARALMNRPSLLLADEPSGNLDELTGEQIHDLLLRQAQSNRALCVVTHDLSLAARCHRHYQLTHGQLKLVSSLAPPQLV
jgi:lipoprotein-releasing system ATP-binding protein